MSFKCLPFVSLLVPLITACASSGSPDPQLYPDDGLSATFRLASENHQPSLLVAQSRLLAEQLMKNRAEPLSPQRVVITSLSDVDQFDRSSTFGRLLTENLMHALQLKGWTLIEARLSQAIQIDARGEFSLSRDISKLRQEQDLTAVLVGTYAISGRQLQVNLRLVDIASGVVMSTAQGRFPLTDLTDTQSAAGGVTKRVRIVGD